MINRHICMGNRVKRAYDWW